MMCLHLSLELVGLSGKSSGLGLWKFLELIMGFPTSCLQKQSVHSMHFLRIITDLKFLPRVAGGRWLVKLNPSLFLNKLQTGVDEREEAICFPMLLTEEPEVQAQEYRFGVKKVNW